MTAKPAAAKTRTRQHDPGNVPPAADARHGTKKANGTVRSSAA